MPAGAETKEAARPASSSPGFYGGSTGVVDAVWEVDMLVARGTSELRGERRETLARRLAWADLLKRVFEVDALRCPGCGGRMRLVSAITEPGVAHRILECLSLPPRSPPLAPARDMELELALGSDEREPALPEPDDDPEFDFDQSQFVDPIPDDAS